MRRRYKLAEEIQEELPMSELCAESIWLFFNALFILSSFYVKGVLAVYFLHVDGMEIHRPVSAPC